MGRKGESHGGVGYVPWWVKDLRMAEKYAQYKKVDFSKYIWARRAALLMEAESHAYSFESKKK